MSKTNFYDEQVQKALELLKEKKYSQALEIANSELSMPYIPKEYEAVFLEVKDKASQSIVPDNKIVDISLEEAEEILFKNGDSNQILALIGQLKNLNISKYLPLLGKYLNDKDGDEICKSVIIFALKESNIGGMHSAIKQGKEVHFNPLEIVETNKLEFFDHGIKIIDKHFGQEVSKTNIATEYYFISLFKLVPLPVSQEEVEILANKAIDITNDSFGV